MAKAMEVFNKSEKGILSIINAADIYLVCLISKFRNDSSLREELINKIIEAKNISGFNLFGWLYKEEEMKFLKDEEKVKYIGQQILLAAYAALEAYLIEKFKEYYAYLLKDKEDAFIEETIKRFSFRSMRDIEDNYYKLLKIHIPSFDIDYPSDNKSNFQPKNSWEAIKLIETARHEIAHQGESKIYSVITLMDSWYPFEFTRRWVDSFNVNFDFLIYKEIKTNSIKQYELRLSKVK